MRPKLNHEREELAYDVAMAWLRHSLSSIELGYSPAMLSKDGPRLVADVNDLRDKPLDLGPKIKELVTNIAVDRARIEMKKNPKWAPVMKHFKDRVFAKRHTSLDYIRDARKCVEDAREALAGAARVARTDEERFSCEIRRNTLESELGSLNIMIRRRTQGQ